MSSSQTTSTLASRLDKLYEFEREPVTPDKLHDGRYFAAMFSGEHIAGTEFVIGALFVQWGAGARDLILGLLIGNLLAVLSWAFMCAPIAVRTRLTLYWYARRIIGPGLTVVYNFVNAMLYCALAAAMIGVSASAVGLACSKVGLSFKHPELDDVLPNSVGWVVIVLLVGALVVFLAIEGFKKLSQFSAVCAPWMLPVFLAGAIASLPKLADGEIKSFSDLWRIAETRIWTARPYESPIRGILAAPGVSPVPVSVPKEIRDTLAAPDRNWIEAVFRSKRVKLSDKATVVSTDNPSRWLIADGDREYVVKYVDTRDEAGRVHQQLAVCRTLPRLGFWHTMFFAWFCNLAMHVGLSDMAVLRYARHWSYGFYSAFGMYLGHYLAWVCAGVMGAVIWGEVNPGKMADAAAGMAGLICVLLAGWTTANPTIYRAGLALQIITPNWPRWKVTLAAGAVTTFVALFPAIFMQLLDFVAIYGLVLMPIGAVILTEHWLFPKLGLRQYWAEKHKLRVNPHALIAWLAVLLLCFPIEQFTGGKIKSPMELLGIGLFFRWLPAWFIAVLLYTLLCYGTPRARRSPGEPAEVKIETHSAKASPLTSKGQRPLPVIAWAGGAVAVLSLLACLSLPLLVFLGASDPAAYARNMASYKTGLMVATVLYFVGGIIWTVQREKARRLAE